MLNRMDEETRKQWPKDQQAAFDRFIYVLCRQFEQYAPHLEQFVAKYAEEAQNKGNAIELMREY